MLAYAKKNVDHIYNLNNVTKSYQRLDQIVEKILTSLKNGTDFFCLQECSRSFLNLLWKNLDKKVYGVVYPSHLKKYVRNNDRCNDENNDFQAVIFDKNKYKHIISSSHLTYYSLNNNKRIMNLCFQDINSSKSFRLINTHVPFKSINKLEKYLKGIRSYSKLNIIACGDMNTELFNDKYYSPTHINTQGKKVKYDWIACYQVENNILKNLKNF